MATKTIPLRPNARTAETATSLGDHETAARISRAAGELQDAMDDAYIAGLIVEPSFTHIENRIAKCGVRVDSHVCDVHVLRKLT